MTEFEKMISGQSYDASDSELKLKRKEARQKIAVFNAQSDANKRRSILKEWLGKTGDRIYMEPYFVCDYESNIYLGDNFYANYNNY